MTTIVPQPDIVWSARETPFRPRLEYGLVVWLGFFAFVVLYEEPTLRGKFGKEYEDTFMDRT